MAATIHNQQGSEDRKWRNKFATDLNTPCGLLYYDRYHASPDVDDEDSSMDGGGIKVFKIAKPVACRGVGVCGTVIENGLDCSVSQIYEQRDENVKRELYYFLPVDDRVGVYRFEFKVYDPKLGNRDNEQYKILRVMKKDYVSSQSYEHFAQQSGSKDLSKRDFLKIRIGLVQAANIIQIKISFISELGCIQDEYHGNNGYNKLLCISNIFFPNYGLEAKASGFTERGPQQLTRLTNEEYSMYFDYPVNVMLRIFQQYLCSFKFLPADVKWKRVQNRTEIDMNSQNSYSERNWFPYTLLSVSSLKSTVANNLEIAIIPVPVSQAYKEPSLVVSTYRSQSIAMLSLVLDSESNASVPPETASSSSASSRLDIDSSEVIFFLDQSGSMVGKSMLLAKTALETMLRSLPESYMFNVIGYGSSHELFFKNCKSCEADNIEQALVFLENACPTFGNNNILEALSSLKFGSSSSDKRKHRNVVIISDGHMDKFEQVLDLVKSNANVLRVFTVAVGNGLSLGSKNMEKLAAGGLGFCEFISRKEDAKRCVGSIIRRLHHQPIQIEKIEWGYKGYQGAFKSLWCEDNLKYNSLGYTGTNKIIYAAFKKNEVSKNHQILARISLSDGRSFVAHALDMPVEHVLTQGSSLLIHRLYVMNLVNIIETHHFETGDDISDDNEVENLGRLSAAMNLMSRCSIMAIFKHNEFSPDNWVHDSRFGAYECIESRPNNGCIVFNPNSKAQLSRLVQVGKANKEMYPDDFSIACLREMMIGKEVSLQENLQQQDGSYILDQEFASSIKMTYNYLTQSKRKTLSSVTWASCIAFVILTNKLGVWPKSSEQIMWNKIGMTEEWLKRNASELDISATARAAIQVLWKYFSKESRY